MFFSALGFLSMLGPWGCGMMYAIGVKQPMYSNYVKQLMYSN